MCKTLKAFLPFNKNKHHPRYPYVLIYAKSPDIQQLHFGNVPRPGESAYPKDMCEVLPPVYSFDTTAEQMAALIPGAMFEYAVEVDNDYKVRHIKFEARAIDLEHYNGHCFLLLVKSPTEDSVSHPHEGSQCFVSLHGIERVRPLAVGVSLDALTQAVQGLCKVSIEADGQPEPEEYILENCQKYFSPEQLSSDMVNALKRLSMEEAYTLEDRIKGLVNKWFEDGLIATDDQDVYPVLAGADNDDDKWKWWRAERISRPVAGAPEGYNVFFVTKPLVPISEALETGPRPLMDVKFPILKWGDSNSEDRKSVSDRVMEHFADKAMELEVSFRFILSEKPLRAGIAAINDLNTPHSADKEFPVSDWSVKTFRYLLDFMGGETGDVFKEFTHMANIWTNPEKVDPILKDMWEQMDKDKQTAYRSMDELTQNMKWIVGVAGSGKTSLLIFIVLMALYGDKDQAHPLKIIYFVPHNSAANDFARDMNQAMESMGRKNGVIRLYTFESEISDWMRSRTTRDGDRQKESFDAVDADRACLQVVDHFMTEFELARMSIEANQARAKSQKPKMKSLSLHQAAFQYYLDHPDEHPALFKALEDIKNGIALDDETKAAIKGHVTELYAAFLDQFSGVVTATPYAGCVSKFVRHFQADICLGDEIGKMHDLDMYQIIRKHNPKLTVAVGDPSQQGPFVHGHRPGGVVSNIWKHR